MALGIDYYDESGNYEGSAVNLTHLESGSNRAIPSAQWVYGGVFSQDSKRFLFLNWSVTDNQFFCNFHQYSVSGEKLAEYNVPGSAEPFNGLVPSPDGLHLFTAHSDSTLKAWGLRAGIPVILGKHQHGLLGLDITRDGKAILAVEGHSTQYQGVFIKRKIQAISLWDDSGNLLHHFDGQAVEGWHELALSPDGQSLLVLDTAGRLSLRRLDGEEIRPYRLEREGARVSFGQFTQSPDGQYILASSRDHDFTVLWDRAGRVLHAFAPSLEMDFNPGKPSCLAFSPNGRSFLVGYDAAPGAFLWNTAGEKLLDIGWREPEKITAVGFSADGTDIILARSDGKIGVWNIDGEERFQFEGHDGPVSFIRAIPRTSFIVTAGLDESLKFWGLRNGRELATLVNLKNTEWVVRSPNGLFDASEAAMEMVYYALGLEAIELSQLKERYYEPNLLPRLLGLAEGQIRDVKALQSVPLFPEVQARIEADTMYITLEERTGGVGKVTVSVGKNKEVLADANPERKREIILPMQQFFPYLLEGQENLLSIRAYNAGGWLHSQPFLLAYQPKPASKGEGAPVFHPGPDEALEEIGLYAVIVGTSQYRGSQLNLKYPDRDAAMIAQALREAGKPLFGERLHIQLLTTDSNEPPRKDRLREAFMAFAKQAGPEDILLIYLSGHGITYPPNSEQGQFYYLTTDIASDKLDDPAILQNQAVVQDTLLAWLREVPARKQVLILDACQSGRVVDRLVAGQRMLNSDQERALERMKDRSGLFILAGSAANKSAFEASRYGHGLLTYSLLRSMPVVAAQNGGLVDVGQLFARVREDVPRLAEEIGEIQEPELVGSSSFDIGMVDESVQLPTVEAKPVFTRCSFELEEEPNDRIKLGDAISQALDRYAAGRNPSIVYLDLLSFPQAYRLRGRYEVEDGAVAVKVWMYKGDELAARFSLNGSEQQVEQLAKDIIGQAFAWLEEHGGDRPAGK